MDADTRDQFLVDLLSDNAQLVTSIWILDRLPHIFKDVREYASWREKLAKGFVVDPSSLFITGSAAFGVSLNPHKNYKFFDSTSDIDVAVVSSYHFNEAWRTLRNLGAKRHGLTQKEQSSVKEHVSNYIYWGTIATDKILNVLPFGSGWSKALQDASNVAPTHGRKINARIYNDLDSLRSYHAQNLKKLKQEQLTKR